MEELVGKYLRLFYSEVMRYEFRKSVLLALFDTCKKIVEKKEIAKKISERAGKSTGNILKRLGDPKSNPFDVFEKLHIILKLPKPISGKIMEFVELTDVGEFIKKCRYGDEIYIHDIPQELEKKLAEIADKAEKYGDAKKMMVYFISKKHTNIENPKIDVKVDITRDPEWKNRYGCKVYIRVEEDGLVIYDKTELEDDLRDLVMYWIRDIMVFRYDEIDLEKLIGYLKSELRSGENFFEFHAEVGPIGIIKLNEE